jgi:hypothetical protein
MKKEDLLKELRDNDAFKEILSSVPDDKERRAIKIHAENFMSMFFQNVLEPLQKIVENDPELLKKTLTEIQSELIKSGSMG